MTKEGIFARVIKEGNLKPGDLLEYHPKIFKTLIVTLSDRVSKGEYADKSGPQIREALETFAAFSNLKLEIKDIAIPDSKDELKQILVNAKEYDFVFTTGGTGIGPREMIRIKYGMEKPNALISRSIAGLIGNTMIFVLPGSVKAVNEYMSEITKVLQHLVLMLYSIDAH